MVCRCRALLFASFVASCAGGGGTGSSTPTDAAASAPDSESAPPTSAGPANMPALVDFVSRMSEGRALAIYIVEGRGVVRNACIRFSSQSGRCDVDFVYDETLPPWATIRGGTCAFENGGPNVLSLRAVEEPGTATMLADAGVAPNVRLWSFGTTTAIHSDDAQIGKSEANHFLFVAGCP